jgi:hypothetical protein
MVVLLAGKKKIDYVLAYYIGVGSIYDRNVFGDATISSPII